jgi:acyl carrier protein phosphodiesterase
MLPDLARPNGLRLRDLERDADDMIRAGIAHHHRVDQAFHRHPAFLSALELWRQRFEDALSLRRGVARALAHVGLELLLDGWIVTRDRELHPAYSEALIEGQTIFAEGLPALERACARLLASELPEAYSEPAVAAERVTRILATRPRLALPEASHSALEEQFRELQGHLAQFAAELVADTQRAAR